MYQSAWHHHYRSSGAGPQLRGEETASKRADHDAAIRQIGSFSKVAIIVHLPLNGHLGHCVLNKMPTRVRLTSSFPIDWTFQWSLDNCPLSYSSFVLSSFSLRLRLLSPLHRCHLALDSYPLYRLWQRLRFFFKPKTPVCW